MRNNMKQKLKRSLDNYKTLRACELPAAQSMAKRSCWNMPIMKIAQIILDLGTDADLDTFLNYAARLFTGLGTSVINEEANLIGR